VAGGEGGEHVALRHGHARQLLLLQRGVVSRHSSRRGATPPSRPGSCRRRRRAAQLRRLVCVRMLALQFAFRIGKCLCASKCSDLGQLKDPWRRGYDPWRPEGTNRRRSTRTKEKKRTPRVAQAPNPNQERLCPPACSRAPRCRCAELPTKLLHLFRSSL
jgi:hypothetical protein